MLQTVLAVLMMSRSGTDAIPAEGLTPFGFLMARAYGQPAVNPIMRHIAFKPSDGAKFRKSFEEKHGPRGRDLIDSLGRGSYRTGEATAVNRLQNAADIEVRAYMIIVTYLHCVYDVGIYSMLPITIIVVIVWVLDNRKQFVTITI